MKRERDLADTPFVRQHRCLEIPEIIDLIFECVFGLGWVVNLPAFVALASTCRAFHQPSVKYLWTDLHDLRPIASVFPKGSWRFEKDDKGNKVLKDSTALREQHSNGFVFTRTTSNLCAVTPAGFEAA
ncbi:hypothetical protein BKA70DRAFT_1297112 [Coprinopsis sp. MPI-PUGE-AT-0042]|nr:hypothetical protein BKA70DRAFT_1297112 [Coprinopsis sp. MPI-PUGE-AT-0042]